MNDDLQEMLNWLSEEWASVYLEYFKGKWVAEVSCSSVVGGDKGVGETPTEAVQNLINKIKEQG